MGKNKRKKKKEKLALWAKSLVRKTVRVVENKDLGVRQNRRILGTSIRYKDNTQCKRLVG